MNKLATRKGQSIILNDNIRITVQEIKGNQVHLVVKAPDDVPVAHEDVYFAEVMARVDKEVADKERQERRVTKKRSRVSALIHSLREPLARVFSPS